jgi:hypothetical protein
MSNETQLQKAIKIAVKDGWVESFMKSANGETVYDRNYDVLQRAEHLYRKYSCNLNYLMPIASRIIKDFARIVDPFDTNHVNFDAWIKLDRAYMELKLDPNNQYTELFEALFNAIKLLENE